MLPNKILNFMKLSKNRTLLFSNVSPLSTSIILKDRDKVYATKGLKDAKDRSIISDDYVDENNVRRPFFEFDKDHTIFDSLQRDIDLSPGGIKSYFHQREMNKLKKYQIFCLSKVENLGSDLSLAYFICYLGGKIKYKGNDQWIFYNLKERKIDLPETFDPHFIITEFDASGLTIFYEGLENFRNVSRVKRASFAKSPIFDDWHADKISGMFPLLEYLDISDCPKVSERAMESFYRLENLKTLVITNHRNSAAFELTCMMLEDCIPGLRVEMRKPNENQDSQCK